LEVQEESTKRLNKIPGKNFIKRAKIIFSGKLTTQAAVLTEYELIKTKICFSTTNERIINKLL
jgi:hypothetical protein